MDNTLQHLIDLPNVARKHMLTNSHKKLVSIASPTCEDARIGACTARQWRVKRIELRHIRLKGKVGSKVAHGPDDAQACSLSHEFVHLSGPSGHTPSWAGEKEVYVEDRAWPRLTQAESLEMADSYATLAWALSEPGDTGEGSAP